MDEQVQAPTKRVNNSIFTKRRVHELLLNLTDEIRGIKSPKAIVEHLEATTRRFVPSGRGRQPGSSRVDFAALQALVDETAASTGSFDGSFILGLSAAKFNVRDGFSGTLMDKQKLRKYVEQGKITLPGNISLVKRERKQKSAQVNN